MKVAGNGHRRGSQSVRKTAIAAEHDDVRMRLARKLNLLLDEQGCNQIQAAELLGMPQSKISAIRNYKLKGVSIERLMQALTALGQHIEIVVSPSTRHRSASIRVAA